MAHTYAKRKANLVEDYKNLRTIPAVLGAAFLVLTLYQTGAFATDITFAWYNYTITTQHAVFGSLIAFVVAFASSETRQFENYLGWEKAMIALSFGLIIGMEYSTTVNDWVMTTSDPWSQIAAAAVMLAGYGVAVQ